MTMAVVNDYQFYIRHRCDNTDMWTCQLHHVKKCKAFFIASKDGTILRTDLIHSHQPSKLKRLVKGTKFIGPKLH